MCWFTLYRLPFTSVGLMLGSLKSLFASVYIHREGFVWLVLFHLRSPVWVVCLIFLLCFNILNADAFLHASSQSDGLI